MRWGAILALLLAGCGSGRYDKAFEQRLDVYRGEASLATLQRSPITIGEAKRVRMRIPKQFDALVEESAVAAESRPTFLRDFPGFAQAYTSGTGLTVGGEEVMPTLTVGVQPISRGQSDGVRTAILDQVRGDGSFGPKIEWESRTVEAVAGGVRTWQRLVAEGDQFFDSFAVGNQGNQEWKKWPGLAEIWVSAEPEQALCVVFALRVPAKAADQLAPPLSEMAELIARTVEIVPEEPVDAGAAAP